MLYVVVHLSRCGIVESILIDCLSFAPASVRPRLKVAPGYLAELCMENVWPLMAAQSAEAAGWTQSRSWTGWIHCASKSGTVKTATGGQKACEAAGAAVKADSGLLNSCCATSSEPGGSSASREMVQKMYPGINGPYSSSVGGI